LLETGRKDVITRLAGQPKLQAELLRGIAKIQSDMGEYVTADSTFAELVRIHAGLQQPRDEAMARADHAYNALQMNSLSPAQQLLDEASSVPGRPEHDGELNARLAEVSGKLALAGGNAEIARQRLSAGRQAALKELGPNHLRTFKLGQELSVAERDQRRWDAALSLHDELRRTAPKVDGLSAGDIAGLDWEHVGLLVGAGRFSEALALLGTALPRCVDALGSQQQTCRLLFLSRVQTLLRLGRTDEAVLSIPRLQSMGLDTTLPFLRIEALLLEFRLRSSANNAPELGSLFERVSSFGRSGPEIPMKATFKAAALLALAESRLREGDAAGSERWTGLAFTLLGEQAQKGASLRLASVGRMLIGLARLEKGDLEEALNSMQFAQAGFVEALGAEHPTTQLFALNSARVLVELRRVPEALSVVRHAEPVLRGAFGVDAPAYQEVLELLRWMESREAAPLPFGSIAGKPYGGSAAALPHQRFFY
jgi:hypothetical protein